MKTLTVVYGGWLGDRSEPIINIVIEGFQSLLTKREIDAIDTGAVDNSSQLYATYHKSKTGYLCEGYLRRVPHYYKQVPENPQELFKDMSSKHRNVLNRKVKKIGAFLS